MFALAEAAGVSLDRESLVEKPLLTSCIRNPLSDFVGDLLTRGGDEQTASRLFALLGDKRGYASRLLHILKSGQQRERQPHIQDHRPLMERLLALADTTESEVAWPAALALGNLGDTRAALQAVEQAVQNWHKTVQFKSTLTARETEHWSVTG
jgi:hypothetical protein